MITDNNYNQEEDNFTSNNQSYVDQYQQEHGSDESESQEELVQEEELPAGTAEQNYLDNEFITALDIDDFENDFEENDVENEDSEEEDNEENPQVEIEEPETFADDGYKID